MTWASADNAGAQVRDEPKSKAIETGMCRRGCVSSGPGVPPGSRKVREHMRRVYTTEFYEATEKEFLPFMRIWMNHDPGGP